jgi:multisubunit Na+/H+ antiporter MnhG subunit
VSARELVAVAIAGAGVGLQVLGTAGVLAMRDALARVHYTATAGGAALLVTAGLIVADGVTQLTGPALLVAALLVVAAPVQSRVTARAIRLRQTGRLAPEEPAR